MDSGAAAESCFFVIGLNFIVGAACWASWASVGRIVEGNMEEPSIGVPPWWYKKLEEA